MTWHPAGLRGPQVRVNLDKSSRLLKLGKVSGIEIFLNFVFTEMLHRDILQNVTIFGKSEGGLRTRVDFFEADIYDAEFLGPSFGTIR